MQALSLLKRCKQSLGSGYVVAITCEFSNYFVLPCDMTLAAGYMTFSHC
jgi:hypothetical protein